jgi:hypothetical protein
MRQSRHGGGMRNIHKILVGKTPEKRPLGWSRRSWKDNIKMDLKSGVDLFNVTKDRDQWLAILNTVMKLLNSQKTRNSLSS